MKTTAWLAPVLIALSFSAGAHEGVQHVAKKAADAAVKEQKPWGIAGDPKKATRRVTVVMGDNMRFAPSRLEVQQGETVLFIHKNNGKAMHEFVLGTKQELEAHAALMKKYPGMEHDEPYMAHVAPGKTVHMVWTFNRPGTFDFACLIPGHFEAGMIGQVTVVPNAQAQR